ncbi:hypothetical protein IJ531_04760 [bacterium]|nr:hypothetical protein [bacterium]
MTKIYQIEQNDFENMYQTSVRLFNLLFVINNFLGQFIDDCESINILPVVENALNEADKLTCKMADIKYEDKNSAKEN